METKATILKELQEISPLVASMQPLNVYAVPQDYFNNLPGNILLMVTASTAGFGEKEAPFSVPGGYFEALAGNILSKIKQSQVQSVEAELNEIAPLLNTISKKPVYTVPQGYFESLELTVPLKLDKPSARVFRFGNIKRVMQYAVAASVAGILMVSAFLFTQQNSSNTNNESVIPYKVAKTMNIPEKLAEVKEEDINYYLNENPAVGYAINTAVEDVELNQILDNASDNEIREFLEQNTESVEIKKGS